MGSLLEDELEHEMERWEAAGLRRRLEDDGASSGRVDFSSNDYLGLARHPDVIEAARAALSEYGAGGRASRLLGGGAPVHALAEARVADWLGAQAALLFPSGYQANLGVVTALAGRGDAIFSDRLSHASLIDAARLSRARIHVYGHVDLDELGRQLERARGARRRVVLTEGVFSMDGDRAPLAELHELCERNDAHLVVDEAHSVGMLGAEGAGAWSALELERQERLAARIVTGGKALGVCGALVVGTRALREHMVNHARSFVFTTAPTPAVAGALVAAVERCRGADQERGRALGLARALSERLSLPVPESAIVPVRLGSSERALEVAAALREEGLDVRAVRPPTVPEGSSRLRLACHAFNTEAETEDLARVLYSACDGKLVTPSRSPQRPKGALVVVGTDTGIGKTVVSALLVRGLAKCGPVAYWKPVQTGDDDDTRTVGELSGAAAHQLLRPAFALELPASPHEAAAHEGREIDPRRIEEALPALLRVNPDAHLVVELAGGLLVPYSDADGGYTQGDWLARAGVPAIVVARAGLGTLNHTLLTLEALRARHVEPRALFLVGDEHPSNRETLRRLARVEQIFEVPLFATLDSAALDTWLDANDLEGLLEP